MEESLELSKQSPGLEDVEYALTMGVFCRYKVTYVATPDFMHAQYNISVLVVDKWVSLNLKSER